MISNVKSFADTGTLYHFYESQVEIRCFFESLAKLMDLDNEDLQHGRDFVFGLLQNPVSEVSSKFKNIKHLCKSKDFATEEMDHQISEEGAPDRSAGICKVSFFI